MVVDDNVIKIGDVVKFVTKQTPGGEIGLVVNIQKMELPEEWITFDYEILTSSGSITRASSCSVVSVIKD